MIETRHLYAFRYQANLGDLMQKTFIYGCLIAVGLGVCGCSMTSDVKVATNGNYRIHEVRDPFMGGVDAAEEAAWARARDICSEFGREASGVSERRSKYMNLQETRYDLEFNCGNSNKLGKSKKAKGKSEGGGYDAELAALKQKRKVGNEGWYVREAARLDEKYNPIDKYSEIAYKKLIVAADNLDAKKITSAQFDAITAEIIYESEQRRKKDNPDIEFPRPILIIN